MIIFESELYANGEKAVLPFKIRVEENIKDGVHEVITQKIDYKKVGDKTVEEVHVLNCTFWKMTD